MASINTDDTPQPTPEQLATFARARARANRLIEGLLAQIEHDPSDLADATLFNVWAELTQLLGSFGWEPDTLKNEVDLQVAYGTCAGHA